MEPAGATDPNQQAATGQILREVAGRSILFDSEGFFYHAEDWSKEAAEELAGECGLKKLNETHLRVISFLRAPDPDGVIFAGNANDALNLAIQGLVRPFDHVVATRLEHNSVLRPLYHLQRRDVIEYDLVPFNGRGFIDPSDIAKAIRPNTRLVIVCHASNVLGTIQPIAEIGRICADHGVPLLIDAAQSAGVVPIDMAAQHISAVAFTGHKSLLGPTGIGGLIIDPGLDVQATRFGGTGSDHVGLMTVSVNGMDPGDVGTILDGDFRIAVRVGLHCAPLVHETIGTYPRGGVRFSLGPYNTMADIDWTIAAMSAIGKTR